MSEIQKAITILTKRMNRYHPSDDITKATKLAISALEKQIPQKISEKYENKGFCPVCDAPSNSSCNYCFNCGQKLDWSDEK